VLLGTGFMFGAIVLMMLLWLAAIICCYLSPEKLNGLVLPQSKLLFGAIVLSFSWWALIWLREQINGPYWVLAFLAIIWLADTGCDIVCGNCADFLSRIYWGLFSLSSYPSDNDFACFSWRRFT